MTSRRQFLGGLAATALVTAAGAQAVPRLSLQGTAVQGYPLFVSLSGPVDSPQVEWQGKAYKMIKAEGEERWRAVIPIDIDCPGSASLKVAGLERLVSVKRRNYGMQYLSISPGTLASYDDPQNKADDVAILNAIQRVDDPQFWKGNWKLPCQAPESTGFGQKRLYNGWKKGWHKGLDLAGWEGQAITAPAAGRVIHRARGIVNGNTLVLSHGLGVFSSYFHMSDFAVGSGETVEQGQPIGSVGGTGGFAPHLHWETRCYGAPVFPKAFLQLPADWR
ncbi:MAG: M23 family metallopeptidase [Candidatus Eremiobacteraeota bacterium]|nr:M23 family metallopeptidase [Candidatus Eremiobacteraeota bacterium]MCW5871510.1 M23 family metallopeptidase [Candidatus Eremiobacteraeota bacterium]